MTLLKGRQHLTLVTTVRATLIMARQREQELLVQMMAQGHLLAQHRLAQSQEMLVLQTTQRMVVLEEQQTLEKDMLLPLLQMDSHLMAHLMPRAQLAVLRALAKDPA
jgi:hypothetical protein